MKNQNNDFKLIVEKELNIFFEKLGFKIQNQKIELKEPSSNNENLLIKINLVMDNSEMLIGEGGSTLARVQHIFRVILRKNITLLKEIPFFLNLDINDYKEKKEKYLQKMAERIADEVILTKEEKMLEVMPSFERRIIHITLKDNDKISTETISQGKDKRVIIKPNLL